MKKLKIVLLFIFGISQKLKMEKDLGLILEQDGKLVLANGGVSFGLQVVKKIPTFEFGGGCTFDNEDLTEMAIKLGVKKEIYTEKTPGNVMLNTLITDILVKKDIELTQEIRARFLGIMPDKTPRIMDIKDGIKAKGIENCNGLVDCQFTHDLIPRPCQFGAENQCSSLYVCCDEHHRDETKCPKGAYAELKRYLDLENSLGRKKENSAFCIRISSANKVMTRTKRSAWNYWASGGIFNTLTGGYTDKMVNIEELERKNMDNQLQSGILENKDTLLRMELQFSDLQTRLNGHICELSKDLIKNMLHFEATTIFNELKIELDMDLQSCYEGFLPLSIPNDKLVHICKDILGHEHAACYMSYSLFSCQNQDLYMDNNRIKHNMKIYFSKPLEGFLATRIHTLPVPIKGLEGKYAQLDIGSRIVFENEGLDQRFIFEKCENRKTFMLCKLGSQDQILANKCLEGILDNNTTDIKENCSIQVLQGGECIYRIIQDNIFLSSHREIKIYRSDYEQIGFESKKLIQKEKGLFRIIEGFVNFNCGEIIYQNIRIPDMVIEKGSVNLQFELNELPVKRVNVIQGKKEENISFEIIGFYSFGSIIVLGAIIWIYVKVKKWIIIEITARKIERLRNRLTPRIDMGESSRNGRAGSIISMD